VIQGAGFSSFGSKSFVDPRILSQATFFNRRFGWGVVEQGLQELREHRRGVGDLELQ